MQLYCGISIRCLLHKMSYFNEFVGLRLDLALWLLYWDLTKQMKH